MRTILISGLAGLAFALAAPACGSGNSYGSPAATPTIRAAASLAPAGGAAAVMIANTSKGTALADASGMTLYTFDQDSRGSGASACTGSCATTWSAAVAPEGVIARPIGLTADLSAITREGGLRQLTYDGRPLYRYAGDHAAGDVTGDGVDGVWHVASVKTAGASPTAAGGAGYSGY
jgi:predicted lipoprotein with Yx(FWY)xxD motif